ncbi:hypothetical protein F5879DRAFT_787617, partial [Lentinula edodes]
FRRYLRRNDCPPLFRYLAQLIEKTYGLVLDVDSITRIQCYNRCLTPFGDYYAIPEASGIGNSYVCFFPGGNRDVEWVSGQIRHIFCEDGRIRFSIQRSLPKLLAEGQQDPFKAFWDQGFQAKTVSSTFTTHFEFVEYDWVFAHTARWDLSPGTTVCLCL